MRKNENGRSMVEMLGVLAIIGVLSVGGIYGYTTAMRKYRANEIVQTISMLTTVAKSMNAGDGGTANITDLGTNTTVGGIDLSGLSVDGTTSTPAVALPSGVTSDTDLVAAICQIAPRSSAAISAAGYSISNCS